jgi:hypothetical protein
MTSVPVFECLKSFPAQMEPANKLHVEFHKGAKRRERASLAQKSKDMQNASKQDA